MDTTRNFHIKKILIPLDFSDTSLVALEHGGYMASLFKAGVVLTHVIRPAWSVLTMNDLYLPMDNMVPAQLLEEQRKNALKKLGDTAEEIREEYGVNAEIACLVGNISSGILDAIEKTGSDLVVMGTHGETGFHERFMGSNAYTVVNHARVPVLTIQRHATRQGFKDILLPIDHTFYTGQKIDHALGFAGSYGSRLHILGLIHSTNADELKLLKERLAEIEALADKHGILHYTQLRTGYNYGKLTLDYANEIGADIIIIMNECEEGFAKLFIGPFARHIVNHSRTPVLSIRPELRNVGTETEIAIAEYLNEE